MYRNSTHGSVTASLRAAALLLAVGACSSGGANDPEAASTDEPPQLESALGVGECATVTAGTGWFNASMPPATGSFDVRFRAYPSLQGSPFPPTIDGVIGLSRGGATGFTSLGPIVRFGPSGNIDARNGDVYAGAFPYRTADGPYEFQMSMNVTSHRYSVLVRHLDAIGKPFEELANDFAFRTSQSGVTSLDNLGSFIDGAQGSLQICGVTPMACTRSAAGSWANQAFVAQTGTLRLEFDAMATSSAIDAVIGASNGAPTSFGGMAAIVRFRPDGKLDVRKGAVYAADAVVGYAARVPYHFAMDVKLAAATYSVTVDVPGQSIMLAHDYAFRTEQARVTSLDHLAQYVDGTAGSMQVCSLSVTH